MSGPENLQDAIAHSLELATQHQIAGRLREAYPLYRRILETQPRHAEANHRFGVLAMQMGDNAASLQWVDRALLIDPGCARYHASRGHTLVALNRADESIAAFEKAISLDLKSAEVYFGLGLAFQTKQLYSQAIDAYQTSLSIRPDFVDSHNNLGNTLMALQRLPEAIASFQRALSLKPDYVEAINNLGTALQAIGRVDEAIDTLRGALALRPDFLLLYTNLGNALAEKRCFAEAADVLRQAVRIKPDSVEAWYNLGNALRDKGEYDEALTAYQKSIAISPSNFAAHNNLGNVFQTMGKFKEAADAYLQSMIVRPDFVDGHINLSSILRTMGQVDEAIALLRKALYLKPDFHISHCNLGNALKDTGELDEAIACYRRAVELKSTDAISHSNIAYAVQYHPGYDAAAILHENLRWNVLHGAALTRQAAPHENDRSPDRRLRVGYVSPDFRDHCQSLFTIPVLSCHDHDQFEIFCYANVARPDAVTAQITGCADVWRSTVGLSDQQAAEMVRADRIDILVDLTMHMANGRPRLFARKPAPVQVAWLAYPGTTGLSAIDYRLTDPYLDPPGENDCFYSEKSIRLPDSFWCYDAMAAQSAPNSLPALANGYVTFGCLNNFCKINSQILEHWLAVLTAMPDSRLVLLAPPGQHRKKLTDRMGAAGSRVEFVEYQPRNQYLEVYHRIDLGLDTFPYNGHTTSLDSYWMGVPVVTLVGKSAVARAGWSQLSNLRMRELAADTPEQFVQIALELARDLPRLSHLRQELRGRLQKSPLMDGPGFARNLEQAYRQMWREWCAVPAPAVSGAS